MSTEILRPNSTVSNNFTLFPGEGGPPTLHEAWDDAMGSGDGDGAEHPSNFVENGEVHLTDPSGTPNKTVNWTLRARIRYVTSAPDALTIEVVEGAAVRATFSPTVTSSWATYSLSWDPSAVSNTDNLKINVIMAAAFAANIQVADVELEIDDTPASSGGIAASAHRRRLGL